MVKVKCIIETLNDLEAKVTRKKGDIFEVTDERAKYLSGGNANHIIAVEVIEVIPEETKKTVEKPKKNTRKKKVE